MKTLNRHSILAFILVTLCAVLASGCQTAKGIGEDVENLGEAIQGE